MLYYIKAKKSNLALKAEACTSKDINYGLYFMKGHQNPDDIRSMTPDECALLINSIIERSCYESVIVSRAFIQDKILPVLLNLAEKYLSHLQTFHHRWKGLIKFQNCCPVWVTPTVQN